MRSHNTGSYLAWWVFSTQGVAGFTTHGKRGTREFITDEGEGGGGGEMR